MSMTLDQVTSNDFVTDSYQMVSGQGKAVLRRYRKYPGKSGNTWLIADQENAGDNIYVTNNPANTTNRNQGFEGFGGATLYMPLVEGGEFELHGGWHSNSAACLNDTGVDVTDKHLTFVVLSKERDWVPGRFGGYRTVMQDVVYKDEKATVGRFDRWKELVKQFPEAVFYYSQSTGGSSCGKIDDKDRA